MRAYLAVFIVTLIIQFIPIHNEKGYRWRVFFTFIPLFLYGALRIDFGLDYYAYEDIYNMSHYWINIKNASEHSELGYVLLNSIIPTWRLFLIVTSAFTCLAYSIVFYRCVPQQNSWLAICLFFLAGDKSVFFMFSGLRNAIVITILLLSISLIRDRKLILYFVLIYLAVQIHTSSLLFMPLAYFLCRNKPMQKFEAILWISIMLILQVISLDSIFESTTIIVDQYFDRYSIYAERIEEIGDTRSLVIRFAVMLLVIGMVWFMRTSELAGHENVICRGALLFAMSYLLGALSMRIPQCFILFFVIGVVIMMNRWKQKLVAYSYLLFSLSFLGYSFFIVWMQNDNFPYHIYHSIIGDL